MEPRECHDLRRFLWAEYDMDGNEVLVSTIEAFFDAEHLIRMKFIYGNVERSMGLCDGECVSIHLAALETIVAIDVSVGVWPGPRGDILVVRRPSLPLHISLFLFFSPPLFSQTLPSTSRYQTNEKLTQLCSFPT